MKESQELPMHLAKANIWCEFRAGGVIGAYFFENDVGYVIVNIEHYSPMSSYFFLRMKWIIETSTLDIMYE